MIQAETVHAADADTHPKEDFDKLLDPGARNLLLDDESSKDAGERPTHRTRSSQFQSDRDGCGCLG